MAKNAKLIRRAKPQRRFKVPGAAPEDLLADYERKRDFDKTPEPGPSTAKRRANPIFVVQEHHASKLHYDFRLESDGVLKSWAVPKQPSLDPGVKRLAVRVEDHPLAYADFTGDIPEGEYGAGHVDIWDRGTYKAGGAGASIAGDIAAGKVEFELNGDKLKGGFVLVHAFGRGGKENWLLMKRQDRFAEKGTDEDAAAAPRTRTGHKSAAKRTARAAMAGPATSAGEPQRVPWTNTDKVMYPEPGYSKGDVLRYYEQVAGLLLPHLRDRPMTLERLPDGVKEGAPRFWQKNAPPYYPKWIPRIELPSERGKPVQYVLVNDVETLLFLVNQGALTFHPFLSRVADLDHPDFVLFDLDPGTAAFGDVVTVAKELRKILDGRGVTSFVKTSGKTGLHVMTPWEQAGGYDEARAWALDLAHVLVEALPDVATVERSKAGRHGHVYVDVMQNARGHHAVPPYVLRAVPAGTVSTPLEWKELTPKLSPKQFTLDVALKRFRRDSDAAGAARRWPSL